MLLKDVVQGMPFSSAFQQCLSAVPFEIDREWCLSMLASSDACLPAYLGVKSTKGLIKQ